MACVSVALSAAWSSSSSARRVTVCAASQLPVVKVSVFCTPVVMPSVSSTFTSALLLVIATVTLALGAAASRTV